MATDDHASQVCECGCGQQVNPGRRFVSRHNIRRNYGTLEDRFWAQVSRTDTCWFWTGWISKRGYGRTRGADGKSALAHRIAYQLAKGDIPAGLVLDHLCHTGDRACPGGDDCPHRRCVNPDHLEPVTQAENGHRSVQTRRTHCPKGHLYSAENTRRNKNGTRSCRACAAQSAAAITRAYRARKKERAA
jgi:hypothetical protein